MATTNDRTIEANGVATVTAPAEGAKVMLLSPSGALTLVTMERLAELVRGTLQVGGRNLLLGTTGPKVFAPGNNTQFYSKTFNTLDHIGEEFVLSCDYEIENVTRGNQNGFIGLQWPVEQRSNWRVYLNCNLYAPESGTLTQKGHLTAKMAIPTAGEIINERVTVAANIASGTVRIFNAKLERGNVETGYSIAPEDIADLLTENRGGVKSTFPTHYALHPLFSEEKGGLQHERQDSLISGYSERSCEQFFTFGEVGAPHGFKRQSRKVEQKNHDRNHRCHGLRLHNESRVLSAGLKRGRRSSGYYGELFGPDNVSRNDIRSNDLLFAERSSYLQEGKSEWSLDFLVQRNSDQNRVVRRKEVVAA